ncbi:hypothetical protein OUZ56_004020 [Daphnia magna]|uniref:Uncharacterized protein n=1 Tax=Daphnia magna TaxID=35525 RepID=A0ABQ9YNI5_9CRUS|nr:hypothetical protein OUZ56_004020 [Daphnia magna]
MRSISPKSEAQSVVADIPWDGALVGPSFDTGPESVVVSVGSTAYLACRVRQLGDRKVSHFTHAQNANPSRRTSHAFSRFSV